MTLFNEAQVLASSMRISAWKSGKREGEKRKETSVSDYSIKSGCFQI